MLRWMRRLRTIPMAGCGYVPFARHKNYPLRDGYSDSSPCGQLEIVWLGANLTPSTDATSNEHERAGHELPAMARLLDGSPQDMRDGGRRDSLFGSQVEEIPPLFAPTRHGCRTRSRLCATARPQHHPGTNRLMETRRLASRAMVSIASHDPAVTALGAPVECALTRKGACSARPGVVVFNQSARRWVNSVLKVKSHS